MEIETACCSKIVRISSDNDIIFSGDWFTCPYCGMKNGITLNSHKPEEELMGDPIIVSGFSSEY